MAMTKRKFYKTTFELVVLSEEELADHVALDGDWVGNLHVGSVEVLNGKQAAQALMAARSEPGFFRLTEDGEDNEMPGM